MRRSRLIETNFYIPVKVSLLLYSFQLATGRIVARLESTSSGQKDIAITECLYQGSSVLRNSRSLDSS